MQETGENLDMTKKGRKEDKQVFNLNLFTQQILFNKLNTYYTSDIILDSANTKRLWGSGVGRGSER
jgi:hypothetical protein